MKNIKVYLSHSIRGKYGPKATDEQMKANCQRAINFVEMLRETCPFLQIHCPAEMEGFVATAYKMKVLSERQILNVDCEIVRQSDFLLVYSPDNVISKGMQVEIDFARKHKITTIYWFKS